MLFPIIFMFFFFNDTATTEIYTLSLHDALPILAGQVEDVVLDVQVRGRARQDDVPIPVGIRVGERIVDDIHLVARRAVAMQDRKSTRLNSSHSQISYAVFCLKKKKTNNTQL